MNQKIDEQDDTTTATETTESTATDAAAPRKPLVLSRQSVKVLKVRSGLLTGEPCRWDMSILRQG